MEMCPGQNLAFKDPSKLLYEVACPSCEANVEFWYDDKKRRCDCGEMVQPELDTLMEYQSCSSYCAYALECLGEDKYIHLIMQEHRPKETAREELVDILGLVPPAEKEIYSTLNDIISKNTEKGYLLDMRNDLKEFNEEPKEKIIDIIKQYVMQNEKKNN